MTETVPADTTVSDAKIMALAHEIALSVRPVETILKALEINGDQFEQIKRQPQFNAYVEAQRQAWNSEANTPERIKLKSLVMLEEWLPEAYARLKDRTETLNAKTELAKVVTRLAGFTNSGGAVEGAGDRISIKINLGTETVAIEKQITPQVIEHDATE